MKFMMGHWLKKPSVTPLYAVEWHRTERKGDALEMVVPCRHVGGRADMQIGVLHMRLFAPAPNVLGVMVWHHGGEAATGPAFAKHTEPVTPVIREDDSAITYESGSLKAVVCKEPLRWELAFEWKGKRLTSSGFRAMACMQDGYCDETCGFGADDYRAYARLPESALGQCYMQDALELDVGECVYGLGERFTPFVKNGQVVDMWQGDGGSCSEMAYKNVPFYFTSRGYGVFVDHPGDVSFEVGSENVERVQFAVPGQRLTYYVFGGDTLPEVVSRYTALTGRPALPPAWSFGLWLSTSFTTEYDEKTATSFIEGMAQRNIPVSVFHFDCFWMRGFNWCDFIWDPDTFPNPSAMLARYKARGLHICVWINPYIAECSYLFEEGRKNNYLLRREDGSVWQTDLWQAGMALVDFTNPAACAWFEEKLSVLIDQGVDCFKTDFGERVPVRGIRWHDGSDPVKMHNYYTQLYNQVVFRLLERRKGKGEALVFARSATAGGQTMPVHWGGDNSASYVSMAETLRAGLSLSSCGFGFWSHDISGFESTAPADVYKRWCAFGLMSSHSRLHGSQSYRVPWLFDEEACDVLARFVRLKYRLMPYLYQMAVKAHTQGIPIMRPMVMMFQGDPACHYLDRQYMLGDSLLVAPVFTKDGSVDYYLPAGRWTHLLDGRKQEGGVWMHDVCAFDQMPIWVRENTILPLGSEELRPDYDYAHGLELRLYNISEAGAEITLPDLRGQAAARVRAARENGAVQVTVEGDASFTASEM